MPAPLARFLSPMVKNMLSDNSPTIDRMMQCLHTDGWSVTDFGVWAAGHEVNQKVKDAMKETWPKAKEDESQESLAANKKWRGVTTYVNVPSGASLEVTENPAYDKIVGDWLLKEGGGPWLNVQRQDFFR